MKIGKSGYLADSEGNLIALDESILTPRDQVAELLSRIEKGEDLTEELKQIKGVIVVKIFEEGDELPKELQACKGAGSEEQPEEKAGE